MDFVTSCIINWCVCPWKLYNVRLNDINWKRRKEDIVGWYNISVMCLLDHPVHVVHVHRLHCQSSKNIQQFHFIGCILCMASYRKVYYFADFYTKLVSFLRFLLLLLLLRRLLLLVIPSMLHILSNEND